jgi:hypothetical protein
VKAVLIAAKNPFVNGGPTCSLHDKLDVFGEELAKNPLRIQNSP